MNKYVRLILTNVLFVFLFLIRAFEEDLFYDPLIVYFQNDYLYRSMPDLDQWHLIIDMFFRYCLNSIISIGIIYLIYQNKKYVKFSGFALMLAFMVLIVPFAILVRNGFESGYLLPFYIRRFLAHPLFLLILLPAFYYYNRSVSK